MAHDVFISYAAEDKPIADALCATLEARRIRCWIAPRDIVAGANWGEAIVEGIAGSRALVLVFSSHANASPQVMREVERAVSRGFPIVPFRVEDVKPTKAMEYYISAPHWLDALTPPLERHLHTLAEMVEALLAKGSGANGGAKSGAATGGSGAGTEGESRAAVAWRAEQRRKARVRKVITVLIAVAALIGAAWGGYKLLKPDDGTGSNGSDQVAIGNGGGGGSTLDGGSEGDADSNVGDGSRSIEETSGPPDAAREEAVQEKSETKAADGSTSGVATQPASKEGEPNVPTAPPVIENANEPPVNKPVVVHTGEAAGFVQGSSWFGTFQLAKSTETAEMIVGVTWLQGEEFKGFMIFPQQSVQEQSLTGTIRGDEVVFTVHGMTCLLTLAGDALNGEWSTRRAGENGAVALRRNEPAGVDITTQTVWAGEAGEFQSTQRKPMVVQVTWVGERDEFTGGLYWPEQSIRPQSISGQVYGRRVLFEDQGTKFSGELSALGISGRWYRGPQSQEFSLKPSSGAREVVTAGSAWVGRMTMPSGKPPEELRITVDGISPGGQVESGTIKRGSEERDGECEGAIVGDRVLFRGARNMVFHGTVEGRTITGQWRQGTQGGAFELRRE